jgi:hypothetical protein
VALTGKEIEDRFWEIFPRLPEPYFSVLNKRGKEKMRVITDETEIDQFESWRLGTVDMAATMGGAFWFRPSKLPKSRLDEAIVHELMHSYLELRDDLHYSDFQERPWMDFIERAKLKAFIEGNEREAQSLTAEVLETLNKKTSQG